ncbi:acyltransferase [Paenibacillus sp. UMB4589-SE434]|uniref:acyltransferase n=1 Tax=Paenibacillus sp. UMB4589-SE434 TaxID=3046314 RepID=UPI00254CCD80|nr:acyltransferase [Paenibacillus sp. UMB4589-SE434]MDK8181990.1 acyltransferase [Paenibacillus sp. UMB4589-SE434]
MSQANKRWDLEAMRGIAIVGVVLIHVLSMGIAAQYSDHAEWAGKVQAGAFPLVWLNAWARFSVPVFLFISGLLLTFRLQGKTLQYKTMLSKRVPALVLPYLFWTVLGLVMAWFIQGPWGVKDLVVTLLLGKGMFHQLYFIPLLLQLIILAPLWWKGLQWNPVKFTIIIALLQLLYYVAYQFNYMTSFRYLPAAIAKGWEIMIVPTFMGMMLYFIAGMAVGMHLDKVTQFIRRSSIAVFTFIYMVSLGITIIDVHFSFAASSDLGNSLHFYRVSALVYACCSILWFWKLALVAAEAAWMKVFVRLGKYAFFIFLAHVLILEGLKAIGSYWYSSYGMLFATYLLTMAACAGVYELGTRLTVQHPSNKAVQMFLGK